MFKHCKFSVLKKFKGQRHHIMGENAKGESNFLSLLLLFSH